MERLWSSLKYEDIYLKSYGSVPELMLGLAEYFRFYNTERMHQSLVNRTPAVVYRTACGGGAMIVDKFAVEEKTPTEIETNSGQRRTAA